MSDGFAMELCGTQGSYQIVPEGVASIQLDAVGAAIESAGFEVGGSVQTLLDVFRPVRNDALPKWEINGQDRRQGPSGRSC